MELSRKLLWNVTSASRYYRSMYHRTMVRDVFIPFPDWRFQSPRAPWRKKLQRMTGGGLQAKLKEAKTSGSSRCVDDHGDVNELTVHWPPTITWSRSQLTWPAISIYNHSTHYWHNTSPSARTHFGETYSSWSATVELAQVQRGS